MSQIFKILCVISLYSIAAWSDNSIFFFHSNPSHFCPLINGQSIMHESIEWTCVKDYFAALGYSVQNSSLLKDLKDYKYIIFNDITAYLPDILNEREKYLKEKQILILWEPPSVLPRNYAKSFHGLFHKILTWDDDLVDNKTYFKFFYPQNNLFLYKQPVSFDKKKFCVLISDNKYSVHPFELYSERRKIIDFFEKNSAGEFEFYGKIGWCHEKYANYKGIAKDKIETMKNYKFCICYENMQNINGYITEKIFDCFKAGCIPVYWGASNITQFIPNDCFIDRRNFSTNEELYEFLKNMSEKTYGNYLSNINNYLMHDKRVKLFSLDHFLEILKNIINDMDFKC